MHLLMGRGRGAHCMPRLSVRLSGAAEFKFLRPVPCLSVSSDRSLLGLRGCVHEVSALIAELSGRGGDARGGAGGGGRLGSHGEGERRRGEGQSGWASAAVAENESQKKSKGQNQTESAKNRKQTNGPHDSSNCTNVDLVPSTERRGVRPTDGVNTTVNTLNGNELESSPFEGQKSTAFGDG